MMNDAQPPTRKDRRMSGDDQGDDDDDDDGDIGIEGSLNVVDCWSCGIPFAIPQEYQAMRRKDGRVFHCPNGHKCVYGGGEVEHLKAQLRKSEARKNWAESNLADERAKHAKTQRMLRRLVTLKWWRRLFRFS